MSGPFPSPPLHSPPLPSPPAHAAPSPPLPKRPCNRYMFFCKSYVDSHAEVRALPVPKRSAIVRTAYAALNDADMQPWRDAEAADRQRYVRECDAYKTEHGESVADTRKRLRKAQKVRLKTLEAAEAMKVVTGVGSPPAPYKRPRARDDDEERKCFSDSEVDRRRSAKRTRVS